MIHYVPLFSYLSQEGYTIARPSGEEPAKILQFGCIGLEGWELSALKELPQETMLNVASRFYKRERSLFFEPGGAVAATRDQRFSHEKPLCNNICRCKSHCRRFLDVS